MPLTRSFNATLRERATRDPAFRAALFAEAVQALLAGDLDTAKAALAGLYQRHHRLREAGRGDRYASEKPDAHVRAEAAIRPQPISQRSSECCRRKRACILRCAPRRREAANCEIYY